MDGFPAIELPSTVILLDIETHCAIQADKHIEMGNTYYIMFWSKHIL